MLSTQQQQEEVVYKNNETADSPEHGQLLRDFQEDACTQAPQFKSFHMQAADAATSHQPEHGSKQVEEAVKSLHVTTSDEAVTRFAHGHTDNLYTNLQAQEPTDLLLAARQENEAGTDFFEALNSLKMASDALMPPFKTVKVSQEEARSPPHLASFILGHKKTTTTTSYHEKPSSSSQLNNPVTLVIEGGAVEPQPQVRDEVY